MSPDWADLLKGLATSSPFAALLLWLYVQERKERFLHQEDAKKLRDKMVEHAVAQAKALADIGQATRDALAKLEQRLDRRNEGR